MKCRVPTPCARVTASAIELCPQPLVPPASPFKCHLKVAQQHTRGHLGLPRHSECKKTQRAKKSYSIEGATGLVPPMVNNNPGPEPRVRRLSMLERVIQAEAVAQQRNERADDADQAGFDPYKPSRDHTYLPPEYPPASVQAQTLFSAATTLQQLFEHFVNEADAVKWLERLKDKFPTSNVLQARAVVECGVTLGRVGS